MKMVIILQQKHELDLDALRKTLKEQTAEYKRKLRLGEKVYKILCEGEVMQGALSKDMQEALELYEKENNDYDLYKDAVLYKWQEELPEKINKNLIEKYFGLLEKRPMKGNIFLKNMLKQCLEHVMLLVG